MPLKTAFTLLSEDEYLAWESKQEIHHEYVAGILKLGKVTVVD